MWVVSSLFFQRMPFCIRLHVDIDVVFQMIIFVGGFFTCIGLTLKLPVALEQDITVPEVT